MLVYTINPCLVVNNMNKFREVAFYLLLSLSHLISHHDFSLAISTSIKELF